MSDDTLQEEQQAHAPLGPSSSEGWATCADYVNANRGLPNLDTRASAEGTWAHLISEQCLAFGFDARDFIGATCKVKDWTFGWTEDDADLLQRGIDWVRDMPGEFFGEQRVDISAYTLPGQFGTLDRALWDASARVLIICDLKWGRGVPVSPVRSMQLMLYALGLWDKLGRPDVERIVIVIDQPRHAGGGGTWECTLAELLEFGDWIKARAALTADPNATRTASLKGCQWCRRRRVRGGCPTFDEYMLEVLGLTPDELDYDIMVGGTLMLPEILNPERRSLILNHAKLIESWLESLAENELAEAQEGLPTPSRKIVLGNKTAAKFTDKEVAEVTVRKVLGDAGFRQQLKSPKQILAAWPKDVPQDDLLPLIDNGEKKPIVVPSEDARAAVKTAAAMAAELDDM